MIEIIENTYFCTTDHLCIHTSIIIYFTTNCLVTKSGLHLKICANSRREYKYEILSTKTISLTAMKQLKLRISTFVNKKNYIRSSII